MRKLICGEKSRPRGLSVTLAILGCALNLASENTIERKIAELARRAQLCFFCVMSSTAILRTRIDPRRKARVEKILDQLGMTSTQAVNMFFAQIERRKAILFPFTIEDSSDIAPPIEHVAKVWGELNQTDFRTWKNDSLATRVT